MGTKDVNKTLRNYFFGLNVLLFTAFCDAITFGLRQGTNSVVSSEVDLVCNVDSNYAAVYIYKTDSSIIDTTYFTACNPQLCQQVQGYSILITGTTVTVTIKNLQRETHEKWWTCRDHTGAASQAQFKLTVYTEPKDAILSSSKACDLAKESCSFTCETSSCTYPAPSFNWYYTDVMGGSSQPIFGDFVQRTGDNVGSCNHEEKIYSGTIYLPVNTIFPGNVAQTIKLECRIQFHTLANELQSQPSDPVQFAVAVKKVHISPTQGNAIDIVENETESILCVTSGSRPPSEVTWHKDKTGEARKQLGPGTVRHVAVEDDLTVTNSTLAFQTTRADQGWTLSCTSVSFGTERILAHNPKLLNILYPATMTSFSIGIVGDTPSTESVTVNGHDDLTVHCEVDSNPSSTIQVSQRDVSLAKVENSKELTFQIPNVTCANNGIILCKSWNNVQSSSEAEKALQLNVRCSPRLQQKTDPVVIATKGSTATLSLSILAYPPPNAVRWRRRINGVWEEVINDTQFLLTSHELQYNLTVTNIQKQNYGEYTLTIANGEGTPLTFSFYLQNKATLEIPINMSVTPISPTAITVKWTPGYDGGIQQSFHIQYKTSSENEWASLVVEDSSGSERVSVDIHNLQPTTIYMLRMFSSNKEGKSTTSEILTFYTCAKGGAEMESTANIGSVAAGCSVGGFVAGMALLVLAMLGYKRFRDTKAKGARNTNIIRENEQKVVYYNANADTERQDTVMRTEDETQRDNGQHQYEDLAQRNNEQEYEKCQLDRI